MKSQIQNKKNGGIGELLITLNKIIRNQQGAYYEQSSQNNQCTWCSPLKYGSIFQKKLPMRGQKLLWAKQIMGRLF